MSPRHIAIATLLGLAALMTSATPSGAQTCAGLPSLRDHPVIAGASYSLPKSGWIAGGSVTAGRRAFASLEADYSLYEDIAFAANMDEDAHSVLVGLTAGYEFTPRLAEGVVVGVCPFVQAGYDTGPDADVLGLDADGTTFGAGLSIGGVLLDRGAWRLLPFGGVSVLRLTSTIHDFPFPDTDSKATDTGGAVSIGVGIAMGRWTIGPAATFPFGFEETEGSYGVEVSFAFGGGKP